MSKNRIEELLREADRLAGRPARISVKPYEIRRLANRRRFKHITGLAAAAAIILIAAGIWRQADDNSRQPKEQEKITALEAQVKQLQASTDAAVALIHEVLEDERRQSRLVELEAELASIPDPIEEIEKQVDKTAFILVYQADLLYRKLNETESAIETYNRVIRLFPKNQWAAVARQRLSEIENRRI